jgi:hypothetical protein
MDEKPLVERTHRLLSRITIGGWSVLTAPPVQPASNRSPARKGWPRPHHPRGVPVLCAAVLTATLAVAVQSVGLPAAQGEPLADCWPSDNGDPVLTSVTLSQTQVDVTDAAKTVRVTAAAEDTGGPGPAVGLRRVDVYVVDRSNKFDPYHHVRMQPTTAGEWTGQLRVPRWSTPGVWRIATVDLTDKVGQGISYGGENSRDLTAVPGLHEVQVTSGVTDSTAPVLSGLAIRPHAIDVRRRHLVHLTARARDPETGVSQAWVALVAPSESASRVARLHQVAGTAHTWSGRIRMGPWIPGGAWEVYAVLLVNHTGRIRVVFYRGLGRLGFDRDLRVTGTRRDTTAPALTSLRLTPAAVDVRTASHTVTLTVRARDTGSGIRWMSAGIWGLGASTGAGLTLVSGDRHRGLWRGAARFRTCPSVSGRWQLAVFIGDRTDNIANYLSTTLRHLGLPTHIRVTARPDALRPRVHGVGYRVSLDSPLRLRFSEAVDGIDNGSAPVVTLDLNTDASGPQVTGHWVCRDGTRTPTSCATGQVRYAAFWPDAPLQPTGYFVMLNPEHSLQITDLAGNPFDRAGVDFEATTKSASRNPATHSPRGQVDAERLAQHPRTPQCVRPAIRWFSQHGIATGHTGP